MNLTTLRHRLHEQLEPESEAQAGNSVLNRVIIVVIVASVLVVIVESEPLVSRGRERLFWTLEMMFGAFFLLEYLVRVWTCVENPRYSGHLGRIRYMLSFGALLDLLAVLPFFLMLFGAETYLLRLVRLLRVLRIARLGRFSVAVGAIGEAVSARRFELFASVTFALALLVITSTMMHLLEGNEQPDAFGSIPRAMWWSVVTLTTVGYGDAYPVTTAGRILAGLTAALGIGLIAMPTGILAAAFSDALQARRRGDKE